MTIGFVSGFPRTVMPNRQSLKISCRIQNLSNKLNDTTGLLDLALSLGGDVAGTDNDGDGRETA